MNIVINGIKIIQLLFIGSVILEMMTVTMISILYEKNNKLTPVYVPVLIAAFLVSSLSFLSINSTSQQMANTMISLSLIAYNAVIFFFFRFVEYYIGWTSKSLTRLLWAGCAMIVDSVFLLDNIFQRYMIKIVSIFHMGRAYYSYEPMLGHKIHYAISLLVTLCTVILLVYKSADSPQSYKKRYNSIVFSVLMVFGINFIFISQGIKIDISGILIPYAIATVYYFSHIHSPNQFVQETSRLIIDEMPDGILVLGFLGGYKNANLSAKKFLSIREFEDPQPMVDRWLSGNNIDINVENEITFKDSVIEGHPIMKISCTRYYEPDTPTKMTGTYIRMHDCTDEVKHREREIYAATHDELTGLLNKGAFMDYTRKYLETQEPQEPLDYYMVCSNIENFKLFNDLFGVEEGDRFLKKIASCLQSSVKNAIFLARMEADRFCVLIKAEKFDPADFRQSYDNAIQEADKQNYPINAYIGVYRITSLDVAVSIMYSRVLMATQTLKNQTETFVAYYDNTLIDNIVKERKQVDEIKNALRHREFTFFLQPQVTPDGKVLGAEALARWAHPERGVLTPYFFIDVMEKFGMIAKLDYMVWEKVCEKLQEWKRRGIRDKHISVNISTKDFYYMDIYEVFTELVERYDIDIKNLKLEITESAIMQNEKTQLPLIERLRKAGFAVEMDDFGSGYSSLNMLNKMEVDVLKLDMGFLQKDADRERSESILTHILNMAGDLHMETIAEGVETKEQAEFLASAGCDILQGYYFSKPISVEEFEEKYI